MHQTPSTDSPCRSTTAPRPTWAGTRCPTGPVPQLVGTSCLWAASTRRARRRRPRSSTRPRPTCAHVAESPLGGRRRRPRLRHERRRRRCRARGGPRGGAEPAPRLSHDEHRSRHGFGVRAGHARACGVRRRASGGSVAARPAATRPAGRRHDFGPCVNVTPRPRAWPGTWRAHVTILKPCLAAAEHPRPRSTPGMGVGGVPMSPLPSRGRRLAGLAGARRSAARGRL